MRRRTIIPYAHVARGHTASMTAPDSDRARAPSPVLFDVTDGVATITLNRPEAMNSLDIATKELLLETVRTGPTTRPRAASC